MATMARSAALFSMAKIWGGAFWGERPQPAETQTEPPAPIGPSARLALYLPMFVLAMLTLTIGLLTEPFMALAMRAAEQLADPQQYVLAVLGAVK